MTASATKAIVTGPRMPPTASTMGSPRMRPRPKWAPMKRMFPIARPTTNAAAGTPARALAAIATIRTPGVDLAIATDGAPPRRNRSVWRSTRSRAPRRPSSLSIAGRAIERRRPYWRNAARDARNDDGDEGDERIEFAAPGRDPCPDDDEVAGHRDRHARLFDEDEHDDGDQREGLRSHRPGPVGAARPSRIRTPPGWRGRSDRRRTRRIGRRALSRSRPTGGHAGRRP